MACFSPIAGPRWNIGVCRLAFPHIGAPAILDKAAIYLPCNFRGLNLPPSWFLHCRFEFLKAKVPIRIAAELTCGMHVEVQSLAGRRKTTSPSHSECRCERKGLIASTMT